MRIVYWVGGSLIVAGSLVLAWFYFQAIIGEPDVPLLIKVAIPAITAGTLLLLALAIVQRIQAKQRETFKEQDY